jgi:hypothetical protein
MKHSKKEKKPEGFSKGKSNDRKRQGPIMIEEILDGAPAFSKYDLTIREMAMRTDPSNSDSSRSLPHAKCFDSKHDASGSM